MAASRATTHPPPTSFVGRERELAELATTLTQGRAPCVTLRGPGGVGKTRLALELVARAGIPAHFVDLTEASDETGLFSALARALDLPVRGTVGPSELAHKVARELARKEDAMIVLDNFEHLAGLASRVGELHDAAPRLRLLVTSRTALGLHAERVIDVSPLAVPEAVDLFVERARAGGSLLDAKRDGGTLERIVRILDGIPLALELCAARTGLLGLRQIEERLERDLLGAGLGAREAPARQATLRGAIAWSWRLLGARERSILAQASVFRGGFDREAAHVVLVPPEGDGEGIDGALDALEAASLFRRSDTTTRERHDLFESVREFAAEKLRELGASETIERHARYFVEQGSVWAEDADRRGSTEARGRLGDERDNLAAAARHYLAESKADEGARPLALRALLALEPLVSLQGPLDPYAAALDDALSALEGGALYARGLLARARADLSRGRLADGLPLLSRAFAAAVAAQDAAPGDHEAERIAILALGKRGAVRLFNGDAGGTADVEEASRRASASGDEWLAAIVLSDRASAASAAGREHESYVLYKESESLFRRTVDRERWAICAGYLGASAMALDRYDEARTRCQEALVELERHGDRRVVGHVTGFLGRACFGASDADAARAYLKGAVRAERAFGDGWYEGVFLGWLGDVAFFEGRHEEALRSYAESVSVLTSVNETTYRAMFLAASAAVEALLAPSAGGVGLGGAEHHLREADALARGGTVPTRAVVTAYGAALSFARARLATKAPAILEELGHARRALAAFDTPGADGKPVLRVSDEARVARRILLREIGSGEALLVGPEARWLQRENHEPIELPRQRAVRLVLLRLLEERARAPGALVARDELFAAGWPGEKIRRDSAQNRLHVTLSRLKGLGLKDLVRAGDAGVSLSPDAAIFRLE